MNLLIIWIKISNILTQFTNEFINNIIKISNIQTQFTNEFINNFDQTSNSNYSKVGSER